MKTLKALVISKSVECLTAYPKIILIKEQDVRQFKSANFRLPKTHCQSAPQIQRILRICVRKLTGPQSAHLWQRPEIFNDEQASAQLDSISTITRPTLLSLFLPAISGSYGGKGSS